MAENAPEPAQDEERPVVAPTFGSGLLAGESVEIEVQANAFLHHMVRNLVGSLVYIGQGRKPVAWMSELLAMKDRKLSAPTFSAAGLYLVGVRYETRWGLPETDDTMPLGLEGVLRG